MNATINDFLNRVVEIVFRDGCSYIKAIHIAVEELGLTVDKF